MIVMEHCCGGNLDNVIGDDTQKGILHSLMREISEAIRYLHTMNIVHRDLKPENILIQNKHAKVSDLGLAKIIKANISKTKSGVVGTSFYLAPEIIKGEKYDFSVDIWALGIIFLELLSGCRLSELIEGNMEPAQREDFPN